jgi:peroxiredoxin
MSGRLACPDCGAVPRRGADTSPGGRIRCRECGAVFRAPAEDDNDAELAIRRGQRQGGSGTLLLIVGLGLTAGAGALLLIVGAVLVWAMWPHEPKPPVAQGPPGVQPFPRLGPQADDQQQLFPGGLPPVGANQPPFGGQAEVGTTAREIEGEDIDGKPIRLSDYRGKVVLLDFWADWCPACRDLYPHERDLVRRMEGKPFALVGVNGDDDRDSVKRVREKERLTWRSFWGAGKDGPISREWQLLGYPTLYVLDARGVIRYKFVDKPPEPDLDRAVEEVVRDTLTSR